jgi:hypothetical protein
MFSEIADFGKVRLCPSNLEIPLLQHVVIIEFERLGNVHLWWSQKAQRLFQLASKLIQ